MHKYNSLIGAHKKEAKKIYDDIKDVVILEKLDGANASFRLVDREVHCYSRTTELDEHNTLRGFYNWVRDYIVPQKELLKPNSIYFGEWLVKHKIDYGNNRDKFYLFDVYDCESETFEPLWSSQTRANELVIDHVPVIDEPSYKPSFERLKTYVGKSFLAKKGEGIVVRSKGSRYEGETLKFVSDEFREVQTKKEKVSKNATELGEFVSQTLTHGRVRKILDKLVDSGVIGEDFDETDMGTILKNSSSEIVEDIWNEELDVLKKMFQRKVGRVYPAAVKEVIRKKEEQK
ncbi:hypothetical protein MFLO_15593 [Listeria floridensis FSL S10-1187]|uniref:RNA ligase domain-containing protein n=1 Tax=Listeria floridensis FSL S10-1187 TaxID=1265817 RepID=A0ABN0RBG9_9LIST|nr:RNA ligase family protein [Listeria floridensis]EUJ25076.1 hypothetical protein MFLO_15593 [Listeria floridensis FSL S10-1187]